MDDFIINLDADELRDLMDEARRKDAIAFAIDVLRRGEATPAFQHLVADLLAGKKLKLEVPRDWLAIGLDFEELHPRRKGKLQQVSYDAAIEKLTVRWKHKSRTIKKAVAYYEQRRRAHDRATLEFERLSRPE